MGLIRITTDGSFPVTEKIFYAQTGGHVQAIGEAIQWLSNIALPQSIVLDHKLHDEGVRPDHKDFSKSQ